ncbi:CDGSH iron-sulfur domain-containing protein 3, mitochondrial [Porphyridium purpureum]|uniref:CDGSH iron-sulfur domain-containing protein 3, mitochondrial n=1 Tax=Porphyridium purpureum TaxID=35688 RepID=A0A5J4YQE3_PORPP|nr:CDGSH iron-sulfur domain-containing protein 3, mitochondrial [Porphyridium purpureum]|eukprot:POR6110..scf222_8
MLGFVCGGPWPSRRAWGKVATVDVRAVCGGRAFGCDRGQVERRAVTVMGAEKNGFFENLIKRVIRTPGVDKAGMEPCPFCEETGKMTCESCGGSGSDPLGTCIICSGKGVLKCSICSGLGVVDSVRRGGTDTKGAFISTVKKQKAVARAAAGAVLTEPDVGFVCSEGSENFSKKCACYARESARQPPVDYDGEGPWAEDLKKGKVVSFCACGVSNMQPYCGGFHTYVNKERGTSYEPIRVKAEEDKSVMICRCGHSKTIYCTGVHNTLKQIQFAKE